MNELARSIAEKANSCCDRTDGFKEAIELEIMNALTATWNAAIENAASIAGGQLVRHVGHKIRRLKK